MLSLCHNLLNEFNEYRSMYVRFYLSHFKLFCNHIFGVKTHVFGMKTSVFC